MGGRIARWGWRGVRSQPQEGRIVSKDIPSVCKLYRRFIFPFVFDLSSLIFGDTLKGIRNLTERSQEQSASRTQPKASDDLQRALSRNRSLLRQVEGIGPLTALSFVPTLEDPYRFAKSRSVGAYLGLVPARDQSGDRDPQRRISKEGDEMLRKLLVSSAHYILDPFGSDSDLRRPGEKIASRGGKNAKKRATVAVARKLAVLLHSLWVSAEIYEPLRSVHRFGGQAA